MSHAEIINQKLMPLLFEFFKFPDNHIRLQKDILFCNFNLLSACGASGVAGGSLLLIPLACSLFGISSDVAMQVIGVGFIIGVVQDSVETALNSSCDLLLSAAAQFREWRKEGREITY